MSEAKVKNKRAISVKGEWFYPECDFYELNQELAQTKERLAEAEKNAKRYEWIKENISEELTPKSLINEFSEHKTMYVLPKLISWTDFFGSVPFDEAIDNAMESKPLTNKQEGE